MCVHTPLRIAHSHSPYAMRATVISTVAENGAKVEDGQRVVGHANLSTRQCPGGWRQVLARPPGVCGTRNDLPDSFLDVETTAMHIDAVRVCIWMTHVRCRLELSH